MTSTATARAAFAPAPVATGSDVEVLSLLHDPDIALAIWRRDLPSGLGPWLAILDPAQLPDTRILAATGELPAAIDAMIAASPLPALRERQMLADDVFTLAWRFATILGLDAVDIRLERVAHDACWKFHRDHVPARLVSTYVGPGTEWVHPDFAVQAITAQQDYAGPLERLAAGDVALFRGCVHGHDHKPHEHGIVHRSPPIAGTGTTRLLLCLNPPSLASPPLWRAV